MRDLPGILDGVEDACRAQGLTQEMALDLRLVAEEVLTNIVSYAHARGEERSIELHFSTSAASVRMEFRDDGVPFNLLQAPAPDLEIRPEKRAIGGLGVYLVRSLVDDASYMREGNLNVLVLIRQLESTV